VAAAGDFAPGLHLHSFKDVYIILQHSQDIVGLWRTIGEGRNYGLVCFSWGACAIVGQMLKFSGSWEAAKKQGSRAFTLENFFTLDASTPRSSIEWGLSQDTVSLKMSSLCREDSGRRSSPAATIHRPAEAAAEVGFGTPRSWSSKESPILGESPDSSFKQAWSQFMSSSVMKPSKLRRRPSRGGLQTMRHLQRVQPPHPTKHHPLAGLWTADIPSSKVTEIFSIRYSFREEAASIVADKISGPGCRAPGDNIFRVKAACQKDWTFEEMRLADEALHSAGVNENDLSDEDSIRFTMDIREEEALLREESERPPDGFHKGEARYFGMEDDDEDEFGWYPCRLYVYSVDQLVLLFTDNLEVVCFRRIVLNPNNLGTLPE